MTRGLLVVAFVAVAFLLPGPARAQDENSLAYAEQAIAPALVRQGEFAVRLAGALALETAEDDENGALWALAALGVEPAGGWQPDQAMTLQIVTELRADLADAVAAGRLAMETDAAWSAFDGLLAELGLPLPAEPAPGYAGSGPPLNAYGPYCDARATHYFYGSYGLPIYSYCYPPAAFIHYYSWVPCGFRAHGHHFAGFFMLRQVHVIPRTPHHKRFDHRFDGGKHKHVHKPERRIVRVIRPAVTDTRSAISRTQSKVMDHKSEIMQRLAPAVPSRAAPVRPAPDRAVRFRERVSAAQPRHAPPAPHARHVSRVHREAAARRMALPAAVAAPMARPAHRAVIQPVRHRPQRDAARWSKRAASAVVDPRAPARFGSR